MIRLCLPFLGRPRNIVAVQTVYSSTRLPCPNTTALPPGPLGRQRASLVQSMASVIPPRPFYVRSSFWSTTLVTLAFLSALLFFLIQWPCQDWTARKDFLEHCKSLQDANKPLTTSCEQALMISLPLPPFSRSSRARRYMKDSTPLRILIFYHGRSALQQLLVIWICLILLLILFAFTIQYTRFEIQWVNLRLCTYLRLSQGKDLDKETWENHESLQSISTVYSTTAKAPNPSGLRQRKAIASATADIFSLVPSSPDLGNRSRNQWGNKRDPGKRILRKRNETSTEIDLGSNVSLPSSSLWPLVSPALPGTFGDWFESLDSKMGMVLPSWSLSTPMGISTEASSNDIPTQTGSKTGSQPHAEFCRANKCFQFRGRDLAGAPEKYCNDHRCGLEDCHHRRMDDTTSNRFYYCSRHNCEKYGCNKSKGVDQTTKVETPYCNLHALGLHLKFPPMPESEATP